MLPATRETINMYQGDPYEHPVTFVDDDLNPIDLTGSTFTARVDGDAGVDIGGLAWTVDTSALASGLVTLSFAAGDTNQVTGPGREKAIYLIWDLTESGTYNRTMVEGRIALRRHP